MRLYKLMIKNTFWPIGLIPASELQLEVIYCCIKFYFKGGLSETFLGKMKGGLGQERYRQNDSSV